MSNTGSDGFAELPPSAKYIYHMLEEHGELSRQDLLEETELPERTVDRALETLQNGDFIALDRDNEDLRKVVATVASSRTP